MLASTAVLAFLWLAREFLLPAVLAVFIAFTVHPVVSWLERRRLPRWLAAVFGTLLATTVVASIGLLLYTSISAFWTELPGYEERLRGALQTVTRHVTHLQSQGEAMVKPPPGGLKVQEGVPWGTLLLGTAQGALLAHHRLTREGQMTWPFIAGSAYLAGCRPGRMRLPVRRHHRRE